MSWWNSETPTAPSLSSRNASPSRRAKRRASVRHRPENNGHVIELVDDDSDEDDNDASEKAAAAAKRRRSKQVAARSTLNDHVPPSHAGPSVIDDSPMPSSLNIHPYLDETLFRTRFAAAPVTPASGGTPSSESPTATQPHRHPDTTDRPIRRYDWERSSSLSSLRSDGSSCSSRPLKDSSPTKHGLKSKKSLRDSGDHRQLDMVDQYMRRLEGMGAADELLAFRRVKAEMQLEQSRSSSKKMLQRARSMGNLGHPSKGLGAFTSDLRKTLDEASLPKQPTYNLVRPHQKREIPALWEPLDSRLHRQQQIEKTVAERKIKLALSRAGPPIPSKLTPSQAAIVDDTLHDPHFQVTVGAEQINAASIRRLRPGQWLNDEVVNCYAQLINLRSSKGDPSDRVHCWNSFFYQKLSDQGYVGANLKRWTKRFKLDIFSLHKMLVPINHNNAHWVCAVVDFRRQRIEYYDSMHDSGSRMRVFQNLRDYLKAEHKEKKGTVLNLSGWTDAFNPGSPKQDNVNDCGVFACQTLEMASRGRDLIDSKFEFKQSNMPFFRRLMIVEIASGELAQRPWSRLAGA
ncbi:hypothetical protein CspHIS471_0303870 [Cutaneotrichosporon sp. HIS471]|nr:hypothetical protein CspHIS471_0303870 [Cutaneotrichosporon sp. HIS471]